MVRRGIVFSHAAFRYVHVVIGAIVAAALLMFALGVFLAPGEAVAPGIVLIGGAGVAVLGVALVVLVRRMLLAHAVARDVEAAQMQAELADRVGITPANLAVLKNGRAEAVRFVTLAALCEALESAGRPAALGGQGCRRRGDVSRRQRPRGLTRRARTCLLRHATCGARS